MKKLLLFIALFFAAKLAAQPTSFSATPAEFGKQMTSFLRDMKRPDCDETAKALDKTIKQGVLTAEEVAKLRVLSDKMLKLSMRAFPHFDAAMRAVNAIANSDAHDKFDAWITVSQQSLDLSGKAKPTDFSNYMNFCADLFEYKALHWDGRPGPNWRFEQSNYEFQFIGNTPAVVFRAPFDLRAVRKNKDSIIIRNTFGTFFPARNSWEGKQGTVDWARAGLGKDVFCTFKNYKLNTKISSYKVDTVLFNNAVYFPKPILGKFEDNVEINAKENNTDFPRFESFQRVLSIDNLGEGVKYVGGFKQLGSDIVGPGTPDNKARIKIYNRQNKLVVAAESESFTIVRGERILADAASFRLYYDKDSIFHPNIQLRYAIPKRDFAVARTDKSASKATFFTSFHNMDIDVDDIQFGIDSTNVNVGKKTISFGSGTETEANFESSNFFSEGVWLKYQGSGSRNPIAQLAELSSPESREVAAETYAKSLGSLFTANSILSLLLPLAEGGFIFYDTDKKIITVKDKVFQYNEAYVQKIDYDLLRFKSAVNGTNGRFNLETKNMAIDGVTNVMVSDSNMVVFKPLKNKLTLKQNRDLDFGGAIYGGYGLFLGRKYHFNYEKFDIQMDSVDVFNLRVPTGDTDRDGTPLIEPLRTNIEDTNGKLTLSSPDDKSGTKWKRDLREKKRAGVALGEKLITSYQSPYPIFESKANSHAYYDHKFTQGGCYKRDSFYFQLDPFTFDSLHTFNPAGIAFDGEMVSASIFPNFREILRVQADKSLGFSHVAPEGGYGTYKNLGKFNGTLTLNNKGLQGAGNLDFLTSNFKADSIVFRPKNMSAITDKFDLKEDRTSAVKFPKVEASSVAINWKPYENDMEVKSRKDPFRFFDGEYYLRGTLHLRTTGLEGSGKFEWNDGLITSKKMKFGPNYLNSDTANVGVKSLDTAQLAFNSRNVRINADFDNQVTKFESNSPKPISEMPYNKYITTFDKFDWDMKDKKITFNSGRGQMGEFISVASGQDSLRFRGTSGVYDLTSSNLTVQGVEFIKVADAQIYPNEGKITILKDAVMEPLENARIIADTLNRYHVINRAHVDVDGKKHYTANGYYEYNVGAKNQEILFSNIITAHEGKKWITRASGEVKEEDKFLVDNTIAYKGTIKLNADNKNLTFNGFAKMNIDKIEPTWFSIASPIDRKSVVISYKEPHDPDNAKVFTEIRVGTRHTDSADINELYPLLMRLPRERADRSYYSCSGAMRYDEKKKTFLFGDSLRVSDGAVKGNLMTYDDKKGEYTAQGKFRIGEMLNPVTCDLAGEVKGSMVVADTGALVFNLIGGFKFPFVDKALSIAADDIAAQIELKDIDYKPDFLAKTLPQILPEKSAAKAMESAAVGLLDIPRDLDYALFFGKLPMKFNPEFQSFVCNQPGIALIGKRVLNKKIKGWVEVRYVNKNGKKFEVMHIYLEPMANVFYYFNYEDGVISGISSNAGFNAELKNMKKKDRTVKVKTGKGKEKVEVEIQLAEADKMNYFVRRMQGGTLLPEPTPGAPTISTPSDTTAATPEPTRTVAPETAPETAPIIDNKDILEPPPTSPINENREADTPPNTNTPPPPPTPVEPAPTPKPQPKIGDWMSVPPTNTPKKEEPKAVEPKAEEPKETPKMEEPKAADPKVEEIIQTPKAEEPKAVEPKTEAAASPAPTPIETPKAIEAASETVPNAPVAPPAPAPMETPKVTEAAPEIAPNAPVAPPPPSEPVPTETPKATEKATEIVPNAPVAPPPPTDPSVPPKY